MQQLAYVNVTRRRKTDNPLSQLTQHSAVQDARVDNPLNPPMPLAAAVAASAVVPPRPPPPPPRRARPLRSFTGLILTRDLAALTVARCAPSPPAPAAEAEAEAVAVDEAPPAKPRPRRYPRQYPGEAVGVAEEMRFVAMRLRNPKRTTLKMDDTGAEEEVGDGVSEDASASEEEEEEEDDDVVEEEEEGAGLEGEWMPSMEGFVKYLVDSKLVFDTVERIVAESTDVACELRFLLSKSPPSQCN